MRLNRMGILCSVALMGTVAAETASAASIYHGICRGGPGTLQAISHNNEPNSVLIEWHYKKYRGLRSSVRSNGSHLSPGECSWSTNIIASHHSSFIRYRTFIDQLFFITTMADSVSMAKGFQHGTFFQDDKASDPNIAFLPNPSASPEEGSIFDPGTTWHMHLSIDAQNTLNLEYIRF